MILIADGGSTKTDWRLLKEGREYKQVQTQGFNPYLIGSDAIEDILCPRIVFQGQTSAVEKINAIDFAKLQPNEQGVPTHLWVQKTGNGIYIRIWPVLNEESVLLRFYSVLRNEYIRPEASSNLPDYWSQALYYALALELGFMYNIGIERINLLGQKAVHEFNKAFRANASEVDRCFVKPCY